VKAQPAAPTRKTIIVIENEGAKTPRNPDNSLNMCSRSRHWNGGFRNDISIRKDLSVQEMGSQSRETPALPQGRPSSVSQLRENPRQNAPIERTKCPLTSNS
jgi:hypothetical protein